MSIAPVAADAAEVGQPLPEDVVVEVDYAIIRHFSEHLYGSPNKAVEELVSNSYDALARQCHRGRAPRGVSRFRSVAQAWDHRQAWEDAALRAPSTPVARSS